MKNFIIETVKWSWPKTVKNPNVYRDDEFVRTKTKSEALEAVDFLLNKPQGLTYTITVFRDNEYFTYYRHSMPCLGGLVKYRDSHGEEYFMNPYFPRDIRVAFPEGKIIYIGIYRHNIKNEIDNSPYYQFVLSDESPWKAGFGSLKSLIIKNNYFVLTNMKANPTVFYSLMRIGGLYSNYGASVKKDWNPKADILFSKNNCADPRRLAGQKPIVFNNSWESGHGYVRPYNESIFKTSLPVKLKEFGGLPSTNYPPAFPFNNNYFATTMKEKFKVDINIADKKLESALVDAWDYFKEEANKLNNE